VLCLANQGIAREMVQVRLDTTSTSRHGTAVPGVLNARRAFLPQEYFVIPSRGAAADLLIRGFARSHGRIRSRTTPAGDHGNKGAPAWRSDGTVFVRREARGTAACAREGYQAAGMLRDSKRGSCIPAHIRAAVTAM